MTRFWQRAFWVFCIFSGFVACDELELSSELTELASGEQAPDSVVPGTPDRDWRTLSAAQIDARPIKTFAAAITDQGVVLTDDQWKKIARGEALIAMVKLDGPILHANGTVESPAGLSELVEKKVAEANVPKRERGLFRFQTLVEHGYYNPDNRVHQIWRSQYLRKHLPRKPGQTRASAPFPALKGDAFNQCQTCTIRCKLDIGVIDNPFETSNDALLLDVSGTSSDSVSSECQLGSYGMADANRAKARCAGVGASAFVGPHKAKSKWTGCKKSANAGVLCEFAASDDDNKACDNININASGQDFGVAQTYGRGTCSGGNFFSADAAMVASAKAEVRIAHWQAGGEERFELSSDAQCDANPVSCTKKEASLSCDLSVGLSGLVPGASAGCTAGTGFTCKQTGSGTATARTDVTFESTIGQVLLNAGNNYKPINGIYASAEHEVFAQRGDPGTAIAYSRSSSRAQIQLKQLEVTSTLNANNEVVIDGPSIYGTGVATISCGTCSGALCSFGPVTGGATDPDCSNSNLCAQANWTCGSDGCGGSCGTCGEGETCSNHQCVPGPACSADADCNDDIACTVDKCNLDSCGCSNEPDDTACDDNSLCTNDTCDVNSGCVNDTTGVCPADDGNPCNGAETCLPIAGCFSTSPPDCDDGDACTEDSCDPTDGCVNELCPDNDGDLCTPRLCGTDIGLPNLGCYNGPEILCDDGDVCNGFETCDPQTGNCISDGATLDCDDDDACSNDSCDPIEGCKNEYPEDLCDDGNICNGFETCDPATGGCMSDGATLDCDDNDVCSTDSCDPLDGCKHVYPEDLCDDGNICNGLETCDPATGGCASDGVTPECSDDNACTVDSCDPKDGCQHVYSEEACDDGDPCNGLETCDPATGGCESSGIGLECSDDNACTTDSCDPQDGCTYVYGEDLCDDGDVCNGIEVCDPETGGCTNFGMEGPECDDFDPCTKDSCDKTLGCENVYDPSIPGCM